MTRIKKTFGIISPQQFLNEVENFLNLSKTMSDLNCLNQGIKTLSIMFISLDMSDESQQPACEVAYESAIQAQINIEKSQNSLNFNIDNKAMRAELAKEAAFSHEYI